MTEMINENGYSRFHAAVPPKDKEAEHDYARRLDAEGHAVAISSDDARDLPKFRALIAKAEDKGLPVVMLTAGFSEQQQLAEDAKTTSPLATEEARSKYIEAERAKARPFPR
ncbi:MAG: hypothetical protein ACRDGB_15925 [Candidatus Limnocylindria bacterium]